MFPTVSQLNSFTNVFDDEMIEENLSQPLSFPTTCDTLPENLSNGLAAACTKTIRPLKHTGQHGEFRSIEEIDPKYRCLFSYPYFNLVQSRIIEDALYSDKSMVVCAPTGSGKTVVFELAILQLLMQMEDSQCTGDFKIIYMAPVKAVCNERLTEWYPKLTKLGLLCLEVTGDTEVDFAQLKPYKVIITTPEKWDMLTRRWRDHRGLVEMIKLFLIDEVHILNDETRGPVLEAVVSRMKTVESAAQSAHRIEQLQQQFHGNEATHSAPPHIRFVAVSATVSNPEDVADWLGTSDKPAVFHKFGDECRPVKLQKIVEGYPCAEGTSIFKFDLILNYKLWPLIQKYYNGKPTLIFCNTRKSVTLTAEALSREITVTFSPELKAKLTALASTLKNKKLQMLVMSGVGCHHAGLLYEERVNIERAFRNRDLPILITTTTLAMGVNLPAHLVIVKNTLQYVNGAYQEYSISTVLQMVGRAGRPQFDTEATAVIMTRLNDKHRYQALVGGSEPLQSYLHKRIAENLNSEAALGTVTDVAQCVEWLRSTFLYVRAAKDPKRYLGLPLAAPMQLILKKIEELCVKAMNSLASSGLITMDEASCIESTEAGRLMSLFYLDVETMKNIMKIQGTETLERLLCLVCESHELSDMHLRVDERRCLNLLNRNNAAATIRFPMKGKISTRQMKLNCIIQATLGCIPIPEPSLNQEAMKVMKTASRICKCLVKYVSRPELVTQQPQYFLAVLNSILLSKCIEANLWENTPYVSKQLKGIGPTFSTLLATSGITSFMRLEESHPRDLERIMNKGPPAGNIIRKQVGLLPKYQLTVTHIDSRSISVQLMLLNHTHLSENMNHLTAGAGHKSYLIVGDSENNLLLLKQFTDNDLISVYDGTIRYEITRKVSGKHKIFIHCVSSVIVGIDAQADYLFLDLDPQARYASTKNVAGKQTAITNVYRERKRKNNSDNDITQCKEKIKRENTLTQKLKALKESFGKTSKALKIDVYKSAEMSNKLLHDLLDGKRLQNAPCDCYVIQKVPVECPTVDLTKEVVAGPLEKNVIHDDDDYIDDVQIDSILSKIESEISNEPILNSNTIQNKFVTTMSVHDNTNPVQQAEKAETSYKNMNNVPHYLTESTSNRGMKDSKKRKNMKTKTNFSYIDLIEKKANVEDLDKSSEETTDSGFSDTIKSQINLFLQRTQNKTKLASSEIDELLETSVYEELPEVHIKSTASSVINTNANVTDQNNINGHKFNNNNNNVQCEELKLPQDNIISEQNNVSLKNCDTDKDLNLPKVHVKTAPTIEPSIHIESQLKGDLVNFDKKTIKCSNMKICGLICESDKLEENNMPVILLQNKCNPNETHNKVLMPYSTKPENYDIVNQDDVNLHKSLIPIPLQSDSECVQNLFHRDDKIMIPHQFDRVNGSNTIAHYSNHLVLSNQTVVNQSDSLNLEPFTCNGHLIQDKDEKDNSLNEFTPNFTNNENSVQNKYQIDNSSEVPIELNINEYTSNTKNGGNSKETHFKRFSYTSTKVDVCTKNYAPNHELRITRKVKVDVDIREIVKNDKINKVDPNNENIINKEQHNNINSLCTNARKLSFEAVKRSFETISKNENENVTSENVSIKHHRTEMYDTKGMSLETIEKTPEYSLKNNNIGNILQKYSKILVKPEMNTPIVNRINRDIGGNIIGGTKTIGPKVSISKSRKPFRIGDINYMDISLPAVITNAGCSSLSATSAKPVSVPHRIQNEPQSLLPCMPKDSSRSKTCKDNDDNNSDESPVSIHSLQLDHMEEIKEESMFNPRLLLQYFNESNHESESDIIAPPAPFSDDAPVYSPATTSLEKTEVYEDLMYYSNDLENTEDVNQHAYDNSSNSLRLPPKQSETWCLSRDDECDTFTSQVSQPVPSAPWIISQRVHNSQVNPNVGSRSSKLCHFKFVRKKPLMH